MNDMSAPQRDPAKPEPGRSVARVSSEYAEFLPAAVELSTRPAPRVVPVLIGTIAAAVAVALVWACYARLDVFTNAAGRVRATATPAVVQPLEVGRITSIRVGNGQKVRAGDTLLTLDDVAVRSALDAAVAGRASWLAEVQRRGAAYATLLRGDRSLPLVAYGAGIPGPVIRRETEAVMTEHQALLAALSANAASREEAEARRARFQDVRAAKIKLVGILAERVGMSEALQATSAGSKALTLSTAEAKARAEIELADTTAQIIEIEATIRNLKEQEAQIVATYLANQSKGIQAAERQVEQIDQEIVKQADRLGHLTLAAPVSGTVQQLAATSTGQIVSPGQALMVIVPDGSALFVEALVPSSDRGFVREGDEAVVKADAFPFTRYGTLSGQVVSVSGEAVTVRDAQTLQDATATATGQASVVPSGLPTVTGLFFIARIRLDSTELHLGGKALSLEPGMTARVEIKTESRRVIDYVLSPVMQVLNEAGHER